MKLDLLRARFILLSKTLPSSMQPMLKQNIATLSPVLLTGDSIEPIATVKPKMALERARAADIRILYQLASDFDSISPQLAAQLRGIAQRH